MSDHWSQYWSQGCLTSFGVDLSGNYTGGLKNVWKPLANEMVDGFYILDIGTGNGALPYLFANHLLENDICGEILGIDLAQIQDLNINENRNVKIRLKGCVDVEAYTSDTKFDYIVSQFGIEYSKLELSLPKVVENLNVNASFQLVCHHRNSLIIQRNQRILELISSSMVVDLWENMVLQANAMGELTSRDDLIRIKSDPVCESLREKINNIISSLVAKDEESLRDSELLTYVTKFFKDGLFWPVTEKLKYINKAANEIKMLEDRLVELIKASFDEKKACWMILFLSELQLSLISAKVIFDGESILAWHFHFKKS